MLKEKYFSGPTCFNQRNKNYIGIRHEITLRPKFVLSETQVSNNIMFITMDLVLMVTITCAPSRTFLTVEVS